MKKPVQLILLAGLLIVGFFGYRYYQETYVGEIAYTRIPAEIPEKVSHESESGIGDDSPWYSYDYTVTFVKEDGSTKKDSLSISGDNPQPLEPNSYVKVKISKKRIIEGPNNISESEIPIKTMDEIRKIEG